MTKGTCIEIRRKRVHEVCYIPTPICPKKIFSKKVLFHFWDRIPPAHLQKNFQTLIQSRSWRKKKLVIVKSQGIGDKERGQKSGQNVELRFSKVWPKIGPGFKSLSPGKHFWFRF